MSSQKNIVILDPIAFNGGSKVATNFILSELDFNKVKVTVLTHDPESWNNSNYTILPLYRLKFLDDKVQGIPYFLRHAVLSLNLFIARFKLGKIDLVLGASSPGVDLCIYLSRPFLSYKITQLVHGSVAQSKTIARAIKQANHIFYLSSTKKSLINSINTIQSFSEKELLQDQRFDEFKNGISQNLWPTKTKNFSGNIFWAASLLKWKRLDLLTDALLILEKQDLSNAKIHICYINPPSTEDICKAEIAINNVKWHKSPSNLDEIRADSSIFVSTSIREPFGLSILEAMAAGLAIVIPEDGAYWDEHLTDHVNCLKYIPNNVSDLAEKLILLRNDAELVKRLAENSFEISKQYRAKIAYESIVNNIMQKSL